MKKSKRCLQFTRKTKEEIYRRDQGNCIFCSMNYHCESTDDMLYNIKDCMHYINKSSGGLGIQENGAIGCRYHHSLLDNGNKGLRTEMLELFQQYLKNCYAEWSEDMVKYKKYDF